MTHPNLRAFPCLAALAIFAVSIASAAEIPVEVTTIDGELVAGRLHGWTAETVEVWTDRTQAIPARDVAMLEFPDHPVRYVAGAVAVLVNHDRFAVASPRIVDDELVANWSQAPLRPQLTFRLETVAGLLFDVPPARSIIYEQLPRVTHPRPGQDTVGFLTGDDIAGELIELNGGLLDIDTALGRNKLDQRRLRFIALDPDLADPPEPPPQRWVISLADGSRCTAERLAPRDDFSVQIMLAEGQSFFAAWHEISRLQQVSPRWVPLTSRTPLESRHVPYLSGEQQPVINANVRRLPLSLRDRESAIGLGMLPKMTVTYPVLPGDRAFHATVGLDDLAPPQGSVQFHVELDGERVWSSGEVSRRSEPVKTPAIDLRGRQTLTLIADYGESADIGDLANWCDTMIRTDAP